MNQVEYDRSIKIEKMLNDLVEELEYDLVDDNTKSVGMSVKTHQELKDLSSKMFEQRLNFDKERLLKQ